MADGLEVVSGQPDIPATPVNVMTAPAPEPAPVQPQPTTPDKYAGKTVAELAHELEESQRYFTEVNERAARAEHNAELTQRLLEQFARERGKPQETQVEIPPPNDDEFLTSPGKATATYLDRKLEAHFAREKAERERERAEQTVYQARTAFERGRAKAVQSNPELFRGIEPDLAAQLTNTVAMGIRSGQQVDTGTLEDPQYWKTAAITYRLSRGEDPVKVLSYFAKTGAPTTVTPVHTEVPSPGVAPQDTAPITPEQVEAARMAGFTREQFAEMWKKTQDEKIRRAQ